MSLPERQTELVATHRAIQDADLPSVLIGGWAVSAFQTRFTTDIDAVIPETALDDYESLLEDREYEKSFEADVSKQYEGRMVQFSKVVGGNEVTFEALVEAIRCRQTEAEWSYRYLHEHSTVASLDMADGLEGRIPEPALLFALKLHSGRMADTRDLVIISTHANFDRIEGHLQRGDPDRLDDQIMAVRERLTDDNFEDSFKGVFQQKELPADAVDELVAFLTDRRSRSSHN